jgi:hypothetical protein
MNKPRIFTIKIETTLLAYCEENELYEFIDTIRSEWVPELRIPIVNKSFIQIDEGIDDVEEGDLNYRMEDAPFDNAVICKLQKSASSSDPFYTLKIASSIDTKADAKKFKFRSDFADVRFGSENCSINWIDQVASNRRNLVRFGKAIKQHSKFPEIKEFDSSSLHEKCAIARKIYGSWLKKNKGDAIDEETENRMNYYLLRYPDLLKIFNDMKSSGVDWI